MSLHFSKQVNFFRLLDSFLSYFGSFYIFLFEFSIFYDFFLVCLYYCLQKICIFQENKKWFFPFTTEHIHTKTTKRMIIITIKPKEVGNQ